MDLTRSLNTMSEYPRDTQEQTRLILLSLFPAWLPPAFKVRVGRSPQACLCLAVMMQKICGRSVLQGCWRGVASMPEATCGKSGMMGVQVMFSRPLPALSCRLNAWVTMLTCQWLMGPCKVTQPLRTLAFLTRLAGCFSLGTGLCFDKVDMNFTMACRCHTTSGTHAYCEIQISR